MLQYIAKRVVQFIPVFFGVTLLLFAIATYMPGADPIQMRVGEKSMSPQLKKQIQHEFGLDRPWYAQYGSYISGLLPLHFVYYDGAASQPSRADGQLTQVGTFAGIIPRVASAVPPSGPATIMSARKVLYTRGAVARLAVGGLSLEIDPPDLGTSIYTGRRVMTILGETYPYTMRLAFLAILLEIVFGIGAGIISAVKQYSFWDVLVTMTTSILVSLPVFWLGMLLQYTFGIWLKRATGETFFMPISGASGVFPDAVYVILPAVTLASVSTAYAARIMRSQLLEAMGQDYIRTARAKGVSASGVLWKHALKNAMIPVVTFIGLDLGAMLSGAVLTETVFNWPGVGFIIARSIFQRDFPVVFGGVTVILFAVMIINLLVDISYAFLDPRIRFGGGGAEE